jgi:hypothetical protein
MTRPARHRSGRHRRSPPVHKKWEPTVACRVPFLVSPQVLASRGDPDSPAVWPRNLSRFPVPCAARIGHRRHIDVPGPRANRSANRPAVHGATRKLGLCDDRYVVSAGEILEGPRRRPPRHARHLAQRGLGAGGPREPRSSEPGILTPSRPRRLSRTPGNRCPHGYPPGSPFPYPPAHGQRHNMRDGSLALTKEKNSAARDDAGSS